MINYCKNRKWNTLSNGRFTYSDLYFVYKLSKKERGEYLNVWFDGTNMYSKDGLTYRDEIITLKHVDADTANRLYHKEFNPITITILCPTGGKFKYVDKEPLYNMKVQLHSIDDSQYGVWFEYMKISNLKEIRIKIMEWINQHPIINGEKLLNYSISLGANLNSKDYN